MTDETEALLYAAARAQLVREVIRPAVKAGKATRTTRETMDWMPRPCRLR
jgi:thymidylate kinase